MGDVGDSDGGRATQMIRKAPKLTSRSLDQVATGWPGCLSTVAATAVLVDVANSTLGQPLEVLTPNQV